MRDLIRLAYWQLRDWLWLRSLTLEQRAAIRHMRLIVARELEDLTR